MRKETKKTQFLNFKRWNKRIFFFPYVGQIMQNYFYQNDHFIPMKTNCWLMISYSMATCEAFKRFNIVELKNMYVELVKIVDTNELLLIYLLIYSSNFFYLNSFFLNIFHFNSLQMSPCDTRLVCTLTLDGQPESFTNSFVHSSQLHMQF